MLKTMKKFFFVLMILSIAFSCNDSNGVNSTENDLLKSLQTKGDLVVNGQSVIGAQQGFTNSNNKFDFVGKRHNQILTEFLEKRNGKRLRFTAGFNLATSVAYPYSKQANFKGLPSGRAGTAMSSSEFSLMSSNSLSFLDSSFVKNLSNKDTLRVKFSEVFDSFVNEGRISETNAKVAKVHLAQLINCPDLTTMLKLNNFYINEINNSNLSQVEKDAQLSYLAIFSYSLTFWYAEEGKVAAAGRKWWKWLVIGAADALGGFFSDPFLAAAVGGICSGVATDLLGNE